MRKFRIILTAAVVAFALTSFVTVNAFADESEGYSEESSGFEAESNDSSSESSSSEESHDEPASEPASSEPTSEEPAPAPAPATEDSGSSSGDSSSSDGSYTEPTIAPFYAEPIIVTPAVVPTPAVAETEQVAPKKATKKSVETPSKVVIPYEPPYLTEEAEEEIEEPVAEAPAPVIEAGVLGEIEGAQEAPVKTPWGKIVAGIVAAILAGILFLLAALYRPYKVVKVAEAEDGDEEKSFISIRRAASFAATLLDSKDFESNFIGYEILKKRDDKDDEAKKIDRLIVKGDTLGFAEIVKATQKERQAITDAGLLGEGENPSEQMTAEEAAQQWAEMAATA